MSKISEIFDELLLDKVVTLEIPTPEVLASLLNQLRSHKSQVDARYEKCFGSKASGNKVISHKKLNGSNLYEFFLGERKVKAVSYTIISSTEKKE